MNDFDKWLQQDCMRIQRERIEQERKEPHNNYDGPRLHGSTDLTCFLHRGFLLASQYSKANNSQSSEWAINPRRPTIRPLKGYAGGYPYTADKK